MNQEDIYKNIKNRSGEKFLKKKAVSFLDMLFQFSMKMFLKLSR
jgi:hypothetical protein